MLSDLVIRAAGSVEPRVEIQKSAGGHLAVLPDADETRLIGGTAEVAVAEARGRLMQ